ncbi:LysR family transcriptional regulator [Pseudovibrio brasiliensis]|uniref:LysR family transcriptional regulator n=2 Tax=Pseudovibrio brasiliensis TaxID=1898042 RepID=A0ABX8AWE5_9HYPH|nr:LysR family transcriptional regulator [Pseudovibrio brasiliensis]
MRKSNLMRYNASHLVVFQSLMRTRNVTTTASELNMSQPAVSRVLAHLREMFRDPLFMRSSEGMVPSARALAVANQVSVIVDDLADLISPEEFEPSKSDRVFRVASTDYGVNTVVRPLFAKLSHLAPDIQVEIVPVSIDSQKELTNGSLDLLLFTTVSTETNFSSKFLFKESYSGICCETHNLAKQKKVGLEEYLKWPHMVSTPLGRKGSVVDRKLAELGRSRHVALRQPYFTTASLLLLNSDLVLTIPTRSAVLMLEIAPLKIFQLPFEAPGFEYNLYWHPRSDNDGAHLWFRELLCKQVDQSR